MGVLVRVAVRIEVHQWVGNLLAPAVEQCNSAVSGQQRSQLVRHRAVQGGPPWKQQLTKREVS